MAPSNASVQPYYMKFLRCANCAKDFEYENPLYHPITLPICGHTMCTQCIDTIRHQTICPLDKKPCGITDKLLNELPTNYPLLITRYDAPELYGDNEQRFGKCECYIRFDPETKALFHRTEELFVAISHLIKPIINGQECESIFSCSMIEKIFDLLNSQYIYHEGRLKALKSARSLGEHICIDLILHDQNFKQLQNFVTSAIGSQRDEFRESATHETVLKSIHEAQNPFAKAYEILEKISLSAIRSNEKLKASKRKLNYLLNMDCCNNPNWNFIEAAAEWIAEILKDFIEIKQQ